MTYSIHTGRQAKNQEPRTKKDETAKRRTSRRRSLFSRSSRNRKFVKTRRSDSGRRNDIRLIANIEFPRIAYLSDKPKMNISSRMGSNGLEDVLEILMGFQKTQVLYTATTLGIFEALNDSTHPMTASTLASRLDLNADATERLLNACSGLTLLDKTYNCNGTAVYRNSACSQMYLSTSSPGSIRPLIANIGDLYTIFGHLKDGIREGKRQLGRVVSCSGGGGGCDGDAGSSSSNGGGGSGCFRDIFYANEEKKLEFLKTMHLFCSRDAPAAVRAFDLSQYKTACDLGGGTGALGRELAATHPQMDVVVADLIHVLSITRHFVAKSIHLPNLSIKACDFFKDVLAPSDLYVLSHVVHDWDDEHLDILMKKVYDAIRPGGALLVLEKILNDTKDGPLVTLIYDLGMLISAGGRERTGIEYTQLLSRYGFVDVKVRLMPDAHWRDAILARKPPASAATAPQPEANA